MIIVQHNITTHLVCTLRCPTYNHAILPTQHVVKLQEGPVCGPARKLTGQFSYLNGRSWNLCIKKICYIISATFVISKQVFFLEINTLL